MLALLFGQLIWQHAMMSAFHEFGNERIVPNANIVVRQIVAVHKSHDKNKNRTKLIVDRLMLT